jgi:hypothetical protein
MKSSIYEFNKSENTPLNTVRTILLFGKNVSTYKFALCSALMKQKAKDEVKFHELRDDFLSELYNHYIIYPDQWTGGSNSITNAFDEYKKDSDWDKLISIAEKNIYNNVFDAFHNVGNSTILKEFELFEHDKKGKKLIIKDNLNFLLEDKTLKNTIIIENETRWKIVEEAWKNKLSPNLLEYFEGDFYSVNKFERVNLRSALNVLLPYQKGRCFYCNKMINVNASNLDHDFPDVDHFFSFSYLNKFDIRPLTSNGIWNLVVACLECNRGNNGKFDKPPKNIFFDKLLTRNILFTEEHKHSLKNSILLSMNARNSVEISQIMNKLFNNFRLIEGWQPNIIHY